MADGAQRAASSRDTASSSSTRLGVKARVLWRLARAGSSPTGPGLVAVVTVSSD
jgi:hypothetical protein